MVCYSPCFSCRAGNGCGSCYWALGETGPLAAPKNDRTKMASAFVEVLHPALPLVLYTVNDRGYPERGYVGLPIELCLPQPQPASGLIPRSDALRWGEKAGEGAPSGASAHRKPPDAQDDHLETSSTSTCCSLHYVQSCKESVDAARAHVGESCSMPSPAVGSAMMKSSLLLSVYPSFRGLGRWSIEMGLPPPKPGPPPD